MISMNRRMAAFIVFIVMFFSFSLNLGARGASDLSPSMNGESERIEEFRDLLDDIESGELSRKKALDELDGLQDKHQIREENRERLTKIVEGFGSGEMSQDAALLQIRETLQLRDRTHEEEDLDEEIQTKTQDKTQTKSQDKSESQTDSPSASGEGKGK